LKRSRTRFNGAKLLGVYAQIADFDLATINAQHTLAAIVRINQDLIAGLRIKPLLPCLKPQSMKAQVFIHEQARTSKVGLLQAVTHTFHPGRMGIRLVKRSIWFLQIKNSWYPDVAHDVRHVEGDRAVGKEQVKVTR